MKDKTLRDDWLRSGLLYVSTRTLIVLYVWLTGQHLAGITPGLDRNFFPDNMLLNGLFQWDAFQYAQLATRGYYQGDGYDLTLPYFPGFPLLAVAVGKLVGSHLWGGIIVNHLCSLGAGVLITRLSRLLVVGENAQPEAQESIAQHTTLFWFASPLSFYFCIYQTEAVFAFASVLVFWAVVSGRWWWVAVGGVLASATRNAGVIVFLAAALLAWERRHEVKVGKLGWSCIAVMPLGIVALIVYQHYKFNDGFAWVHTPGLWNRFLTTPWRTIKDEWVGWPSLDKKTRSVQAMYEVQELLTLTVLIPFFFLRKRLNLPWALLLLGVFEWILPTTSHSLMSASRYQSGNIYFALAIPALLTPRPMLKGVVWMGFGMVLAWFASTWPYGFFCS